MYKFYSGCGILGLSRFEDGRDLPPQFNTGADTHRYVHSSSYEEWLATSIRELVEEENLEITELLWHLTRMTSNPF